MKYICLLTAISSLTLMSCSSTDPACEDVTMASEQIQACQSLQRQIVNSKGKPLIRTELERRYQVDCIETRFYRDDMQPAVCGNKEKIDEITEAVKRESQQ